MMNSTARWALVTYLAVTATPATAGTFTDTTITGPARVIDGDTVEINGSRIRLHGIDAPEKDQFCLKTTPDGLVQYDIGKESTQALSWMAEEDGTWTCQKMDTDSYGRIVAKCGSKKVSDYGESMVAAGLAFAYRKYSKDYVDEEELAAKHRVGVWGMACQLPWDYRKKKK